MGHGQPLWPTRDAIIYSFIHCHSWWCHHEKCVRLCNQLQLQLRACMSLLLYEWLTLHAWVRCYSCRRTSHMGLRLLLLAVIWFVKILQMIPTIVASSAAAFLRLQLPMLEFVILDITKLWPRINKFPITKWIENQDHKTIWVELLWVGMSLIRTAL